MKKVANVPPEKGSLELTEDIIRVRAYQLFEQRGYEHGHDLEDWFQAEAEIIGQESDTRADVSTSLHTVAAA